MIKAYWTRTTCRGLNNHDHSITVGATEIDRDLWLGMVDTPVRVKADSRNELYRVFASINYWPSTGRMLVNVQEGATAEEMRAAIATARCPREDPGSWPDHPCEDRKRISLYRYVDEGYADEVAEQLFEDLIYDEQNTILSSLGADGGTAA